MVINNRNERRGECIMKKVKLLAISLVISIMLMGVGYAAWTSTSNITTSANTGSFSIRLEKDDSGTVTYKSDYENDGHYDNQYTDNIYAKVIYNSVSNPSGGSSSASIIFKDLYPGSTAISDIKVTNNSTLPIKYGTINYSISAPNSGSVISNDKIHIYAIINNQQYPLIISDNSIDLTDNHAIDAIGGQNISHIKLKVVVPSTVSDSFGSGLQIQLTPTFKQYNS